MSRILFEDEYVIVVPTFEKVTVHTHSFSHIFFLGDSDSCEEIFVTGSLMKHTMPPLSECRCFLMIDPTSDLAENLRDTVLTEGEPRRMRAKVPFRFSEELDDAALSEIVRQWLSDCGYLRKTEKPGTVEDPRVVKLIREIREYRHLEKRLKEIADEYEVSESRLSHIFKETVGVSLKGYLMIAQMKYAYSLVMEGKSKTYAALEAGFASPAHLAYICKKHMGISITDVLK